MRSFARATTLILATTGLLAACGGGEPTAPDTGASATATLVADDATATVYVALGDTARVVPVADPATSTAWDLSFFTTTIAPNAGVTVYCLCDNESASGAAVMAMTPASQLDAFERVTAANIPAASSFSADVFATHKWYRYNITGTDNQIWPVFNVYLVRRGTAVYKVQVVNYYNAAGEPRHVSIRYARLQR